MILYFLIFTCFIFLLFNFIFENRDFLSPSCVFCIMILGSLLMCVISKRDYSFELHGITYFIMLLGIMIFSLFSLFRYVYSYNRKSSINELVIKNQVEPFVLSKTVLIVFFLTELAVGYFAVKYIVDISIAHTGSFSTISVAIGIYDNLSKFDTNTLQELNVARHPIYSFGWSLLTAISYILIYIICHNFVLFKKVEFAQITIVILYFILTFLSGGRTYAFRIITAFVTYIYYFNCLKRGFHKRQISFIIKMFMLAILVVFFFTIMRSVLGRSLSNYKWYHTLFSYFGAPIVNLDHYLITSSYPTSELFAQESLYGIYNYIGHWLDIEKFRYSLDLPFVFFTGRNTGNVYTMYYQFIHDFGVVGVIPMVMIIAMVYNKLYRVTVRNVKQKKDMSIYLFYYGYLINDLIMLMFSNKFYETVVAINFLRFFVWVWIIWMCIVQKRITYQAGKIIVTKRV